MKICRFYRKLKGILPFRLFPFISLPAARLRFTLPKLDASKSDLVNAGGDTFILYRASSFLFKNFCVNWKRRVNNDDILFKSVNYTDIGFFATVSIFSETDLYYQLLYLGVASELPADQLKIDNRSMLEKQSSIGLPQSLIRGHVSSHQLLHQGFDRDSEEIVKSFVLSKGELYA